MNAIFIVTGIIQDDGVFDILYASTDYEIANEVADENANDYDEVRVTSVKVDYLKLLEEENE